MSRQTFERAVGRCTCRPHVCAARPLTDCLLCAMASEGLTLQFVSRTRGSATREYQITALDAAERELSQDVAAAYGVAWVLQRVVYEHADAEEELPEAALVRLHDGTWATFDARAIRRTSLRETRCRALTSSGPHVLEDVVSTELERLTSVVIWRTEHNTLFVRTLSASLRKEHCLRSNTETRNSVRTALRTSRRTRALPPPLRLEPAQLTVPRALTRSRSRPPAHETCVDLTAAGSDSDQDGAPPPDTTHQPTQARTIPEVSPGEVHVVKRMRLLNEFRTFLPPLPSDIVQEGEQCTCSSCGDTLAVGHLVARGTAPCVFGPLCRTCTEGFVRMCINDRREPMCTYCPERHSVPPVLLARVLPDVLFVELRKTLAHVQSGKLDGWEATRVCPACSRPGLLLCFNTPSFSCNFCNRGPRDGWCAFCLREYSSTHTCMPAEARDVTVSDILRMMDDERLPVVHPCPTCRQIAIKEDAGQCNHMTCQGCSTQYCGVCGESWDSRHSRDCAVNRAYVEETRDDHLNIYTQAHENMFVKASIVAAYARITREPVPEDLCTYIASIQRQRDLRARI